MVELAPAFGLDAQVRQALHRDALKLARHVKYRNAGTVEFMVDKNGAYYFLEVNPRIQVSALPHVLCGMLQKSGHRLKHYDVYMCQQRHTGQIWM